MRVFSEGNLVQVEIQDILALVVGYGMAALLFRAFWPVHPVWTSLGLPGAGLYLWLGLAMSGPIIMLRRKLFRPARATNKRVSENVDELSHGQLPLPAAREPIPRVGNSGTTWAERAWLFIGSYWIVLGLFIIPARLHEFKLGDIVLFGLAPIVAAIGLRLLGPSAVLGPNVVRSWTHTAAIAILLTWPLAWVCLIVLGRSIR